MKIRPGAFNTILLVLLALSWGGCKTDEETKKDKEVTTLRIHLETNPDASDRTSSVPIGRGPLMYVTVDKSWFLNEGDVEKATLLDNIDKMGTFAIAIQFDAHGTLLLDATTSRYKGYRLVVWMRADEALWVAAPKIARRMSNGLFVFTPDITHEEAERMVLGLNNIVKKLHKKDLVH